jgi:hypothetical protein
MTLDNLTTGDKEQIQKGIEFRGPVWDGDSVLSISPESDKQTGRAKAVPAGVGING